MPDIGGVTVAQVLYSQIYNTMSEIHRKYNPPKHDGEYFADVSAELIKAIADLDHHPFANALAHAIYDELERTAKRD